MPHPRVRASATPKEPRAASETICADLGFPREKRITEETVFELAEAALSAIGEVQRATPERHTRGTVFFTQTLEVSIETHALRDSGRVSIMLNHNDHSITESQRKARLAGLVWHMLTRLPASEVFWLHEAQALPREAFLGSLAPAMTSGNGPVAPRRCAVPEAIASGRPSRRASVIPRPVSARAANANRRSRPVRSDAHVRAYEAHIRDCLTRDASESELAELEEATGVLPAEARLATWAVSLTVAVISLPMAVPVIAANLVRGEDFRAASLVLGLAGTFTVLDDTRMLSLLMAV